MEMREFKISLGPLQEQNPLFREVHYAAQFANDDGKCVELRRSTRLHAPFFGESYSAAWLLSHIIAEFMAEVADGS